MFTCSNLQANWFSNQETLYTLLHKLRSPILNSNINELLSSFMKYDSEKLISPSFR